MEVRLPGAGKFELLERMSEAGISMPVIFVSHTSDVRTVVQAMKRGAVNFLTKLVEEATLLGRQFNGTSCRTSAMTCSHD